jgi:hypothetical protein
MKALISVHRCEEFGLESVTHAVTGNDVIDDESPMMTSPVLTTGQTE